MFLNSLYSNSHYLSLTSSFKWPMPPGPYRAMTCRGRELNCGSHTYFFDHTRTWRSSPDEWSAQCRGHLRDSSNMTDNTHQAHTQSSQQGEYGMMMTTVKWYSGEPWGLKLAGIYLTVEKKPYPGNLSRPEIEPGPAAWQASMIPPAPQRWTIRVNCHLNYWVWLFPDRFLYVTHAVRTLLGHDLSGEGINLWITYMLFWSRKDMEGHPGWGISSMPVPPPRQHKHKRRYTPLTHPFIPAIRI